MSAQQVPDDEDLIDLDELTRRVGMSVRNVRYYTTKGLVPPPIRRGRSGYYGPDHVARFELVQELQAHGFTLSAIERYLARIPADATAETIALHRTMLAPWSPTAPDVTDALLDLGLPVELALRTKAIFDDHAKALADELGQILHDEIWPAYKEHGITTEAMMQAIENFKPVSIAALVAAYEQAINDARRELAARRTKD